MIIYNSKGIVLLDIDVDDDSFRYKAIKGENYLELRYSLSEHIEIPVGSYAMFKNEKYILMSPQDLQLKHRRYIEYSIVMYSEEKKAQMYKFRNPVDGRLKFELTAKPVEHLQMFVDNMNMRDGNDYWSVGLCPDHVEIVLSYNHTYCHDALVQLANKLDLDYWYEGHTVNLGKLEINKDNPLSLSYGGDGEGLQNDIKRTNYNDGLPIEVLYIQGSEKNIDRSKYGSLELHMPTSVWIGYDGEFFSDEDGFNVLKARYYKTDDKGFSVMRADKGIQNNSEDSLDCSEIYPTKEETVESVIEVNKEKHFYDLLFKSTVDYSKYIIDGEKATIIFQSGMLAGKEFELATDTDGNLICKPDGEYMRVEIVPQEIDGITMPDQDSGYMPNNGEDKDTFKVFNVQLPEEYIRHDETKSGAEWDMFRYAVKHFYANEEPQYTIAGTLDEIYAKRNWENIESRLCLGNYISFSDKSFQEEPLDIRIIGIKEFVNRPHSPAIEFSNKSIGGTIVGTLHRIKNEEAHTEEMYKQSRSFTKRRFRSAEETLEMLQAAFTSFSKGISPVTVRTMAMLVGDESLQFKFTNSRDSLANIDCPLFYDMSTKQMIGNAASVIHMTLGITDVVAKGSRVASDYHGWDLLSWSSAILDDSDKSYYLYIKAKQSVTSAEYMLSSTPISMDEECNDDGTGYYHFLVGILNSEHNGSRDFVTLYGFTEVLPGQITTDIIRSADGKTFFDLLNGIIGGHIKFITKDGKSKDIAEYAAEQTKLVQDLNSDNIFSLIEKQSVRLALKEISPYEGNNLPSDIEEGQLADWYRIIESKGLDPVIWDAAYDAAHDLFLYLADTGHVWKDSNTEVSDDFRDNVSNLFNAYNKEINALLEHVPSSDLEYLKTAFASGETHISGGVVMSDMVAVKDNDDIKAFLNGSDFAKDNTESDCGKLILAAGIPSGTDSLKERARRAKTRIYEDGCTKTNKLFLEEGCKIGNFEIQKEGDKTVITVGGCGTAWENMMNLSQTMLQIAKVINTGTACMIKDAAMYAEDGVTVEKTLEGSDNPILTLRGQSNLPIAVSLSCGMFEGLRPKVRTVTSSDELDALDHTILCVNTSSLTLTLLSNPVAGQEYKIMLTAASTVTLEAHAGIINVPTSNTYNASSVNMSSIGVRMVVYAPNTTGAYRWWVYPL